VKREIFIIVGVGKRIKGSHGRSKGNKERDPMELTNWTEHLRCRVGGHQRGKECKFHDGGDRRINGKGLFDKGPRRTTQARRGEANGRIIRNDLRKGQHVKGEASKSKRSTKHTKTRSGPSK